MKLGWIVTAFALSASGGLQAQQAPSPAPAAIPSPVPVKEKRVCRTDSETGSIVPKRTCHTKAEWAEIETEAERSPDMEAFRTNRNRTH